MCEGVCICVCVCVCVCGHVWASVGKCVCVTEGDCVMNRRLVNFGLCVYMTSIHETFSVDEVCVFAFHHLIWSGYISFACLLKFTHMSAYLNNGLKQCITGYVLVLTEVNCDLFMFLKKQINCLS